MKKTKNVIYSAISLILSALMLTSCANNAPAQTTPSETETLTETTAAVTQPEPLLPTEKTFFPYGTIVKHIGRTLIENDTLWLAHSASGIEFSFRGSKASMVIVGDNTVYGDENSQARFAVYVNGDRTLDEMVTEEEKSYEIFSSDVSEDVTIRVVKLSESGNSAFGIKDITVVSEGAVLPTPEKDVKIEFIGDSLTCAYGVDDEVKEHHFSTKTEDATKSFAYKTAQMLGADYSMVCFSGHGIISGYTSGKKNTFQLVQPIYEQFTNTSSAKDFCTIDTPWDFTKFVPDYIVINLGTNDNSYTKSVKERKDEFAVEYAEFLKMVRKDNPGAHIICTLGLSGDELYSSIKDAVAMYSAETGDTNLSTFRFSPQDIGKNGAAADWHPTEKSHEIAAHELTGYIRELIRKKDMIDIEKSVALVGDLKCEWTEEDRKVQEFLTSSKKQIDEFCDMLFTGRDFSGQLTEITRVYPESLDPNLEHHYLQQYYDSFGSTVDIRSFMKEYFSDELYKTYSGIMLDGWNSDGEYVPPRFIDFERRLYREEGVRNREVILNFSTAKVIAHDGDTIIYACIGNEHFAEPALQALYGSLKYENGELKYNSLPWYIYEYNGELRGDINAIWGI